MADRSTVVVTGGAGFIGSELVRQLAARGERVVIVDNLVNGKRENVADVLSRHVTLLVTDIRDVGAIAPHLHETRAVYHLACLGVRHSVHSPHENHEVNATATLQLLAAARQADVPRFVCVSSSEVYGGVQSTPIRGERIGEDHPAFPCTVYGGSKLAGESLRPCVFPHLRLSHRRRASIQHLRSAIAPRGRQRGSDSQVPPALSGRAPDGGLRRWLAVP